MNFGYKLHLQVLVGIPSILGRPLKGDEEASLWRKGYSMQIWNTEIGLLHGTVRRDFLRRTRGIVGQSAFCTLLT